MDRRCHELVEHARQYGRYYGKRSRCGFCQFYGHYPLVLLQCTDIYVFILIGFIGAVLGFLTYNKPPSKLFMGDSGSQLIGYTVAFFSVYLLWNFKGVNEIPFWLSTLMLMMILAAPFVDTFTVVFNRIKRGTSPAKEEKTILPTICFMPGSVNFKFGSYSP